MSRQVGALHRSNSHPANLQNPIPIISLFAFPHLTSQILIYHQARVQTLTQIFQFFILSHNLITITQTSKLPMDLQTLNDLLLPIPKPTLQIFHNPLFNPSIPVNHYHPFPLPLMHPKSPQHIPHPFLKYRTITPQILHKSYQN